MDDSAKPRLRGRVPRPAKWVPLERLFLLPGLVAARGLLSRHLAAGGGLLGRCFAARGGTYAGRLDDLARVVFGRNALASPGVSAFLLAHLSGPLIEKRL
jgi:hypothetical protein